ncbi:MAG: hypothetical protein K9L84_03515 [Candidatus Omnitrophica bacterium]|nr:hypothetical protein [Candidatus Omnitrophota bacterium]MCF7894107.1 hypothetical protein [Candidatus Omnitrophota bacterium]
MRNKLSILFIILLILFLPLSYGQNIYYEGKISPLRLIQTMNNSFYQIDSVKALVNYWAQSRSFHWKISTTNLIKNFDNLKVTGRASVSSLLPNLDYSSSSWVQQYVIRGVPFVWNSKERRWENKSLSISDKKDQERLEYSLIESLFYINQHRWVEDSLEYLGQKKKKGKICYLISYKLDPAMFKQKMLIADLEVKVWINRDNFLPVFQEIEGTMGYEKILHRTEYKDYDKKFNFNTPQYITQQVRKEKKELKDKVNELKEAVARLRGWSLEDIKALKIKFVNRSIMRNVMIEQIKNQYTKELIENEGVVFKWLNLIPEEIDYQDLVINSSDAALIAGFYEPEDKVIYLGDYLDPAVAEIVLVHELVHAFQDKKLDLNKLTKSTKYNKDYKFALNSLVEGEATAVEAEYLLSKKNESFTELGDITNFIEQKIIKNSSLINNNLFYNVYGYGADFIQNWLQDNSWEDISLLYKNPPTTAREIMHPLLYSFREKIERSDKKRAGSVEVKGVKLSNEWHNIYSTSLGEYFIFLSLQSRLNTDLAKNAALGWENDQITLYKRKGDRQLIVFLTKWNSYEDAAFYYDVFKKWIKAGKYSVEEKTDVENFIWVNQNNDKITAKIIKDTVAIVGSKKVDKYEFKNVIGDIMSQLKRGGK